MDISPVSVHSSKNGNGDISPLPYKHLKQSTKQIIYYMEKNKF